MILQSSPSSKVPSRRNPSGKRRRKLLQMGEAADRRPSPPRLRVAGEARVRGAWRGVGQALTTFGRRERLAVRATFV